MDKSIEKIINKMPESVKDFYLRYKDRNITEIRLRKGFNVKISVGGIYQSVAGTNLSENEINTIFYSLCNHSVSAYEEQLAKGFITVEGGHRVGVAGKFAFEDNRYLPIEIYSMNIRLLKFHLIDIDKSILEFKKGLLIAGKPHSGKTTFIKNLCFYMQDKNIVVCDERSELYSEIINCDYIINVPKYISIQQAVRTMNPDYIVCDEIGSSDEISPIINAVISGVKFICSVHRNSTDELYRKPGVAALISSQIFDRIILLENYGNKFYIKEITDV